eukprot:m.1485126 g.1485126  ORF g.1485126 m.1485126 type:complete len:474 (-) comp25181_c1_seq4:2424-3845(-)
MQLQGVFSLRSSPICSGRYRRFVFLTLGTLVVIWTPRAAGKEDIANLDDYLHRIKKMTSRPAASTSTASPITNPSLHAIVSHRALPQFFQRHAQRMVYAASQVASWTARKNQALEALGTDPVLVAVGLAAQQVLAAQAEKQREAAAARAEAELLAMETRAETFTRGTPLVSEQRTVAHTRAKKTGTSNGSKGKAQQAARPDDVIDNSDAAPATVSPQKAPNTSGTRSTRCAGNVGTKDPQRGQPVNTTTQALPSTKTVNTTTAVHTRVSQLEKAPADDADSAALPVLECRAAQVPASEHDIPVVSIGPIATAAPMDDGHGRGSPGAEDDDAWEEHRTRRKPRGAQTAPAKHVPPGPRMHPVAQQTFARDTPPVPRSVDPQLRHKPAVDATNTANPRGTRDAADTGDAGVRPSVLCSPSGNIVVTDDRMCRAWLRGECSKVRPHLHPASYLVLVQHAPISVLTPWVHQRPPALS